MAAILELRDVSFFTREADVLRPVSYAYESGKTTALVGPPGSGKSILLKLSAGLLLPSKGTVLFKGQDIAGMNRLQNLAFRKQSAVVFQDSALWANQSIYQNLELPLKIHYPNHTGKDRDRRIKEVLAEVGYSKDIHLRPADLSRGEQKLVAFARAMLCSPGLLFLDEWTESLDDNASSRLIAIVRQMRQQGGTVIFVSHNPAIIRNLADYILPVVNGKLSAVMTKEQFTGELTGIIS